MRNRLGKLSEQLLYLFDNYRASWYLRQELQLFYSHMFHILFNHSLRHHCKQPDAYSFCLFQISCCFSLLLNYLLLAYLTPSPHQPPTPFPCSLMLLYHELRVCVCSPCQEQDRTILTGQDLVIFCYFYTVMTVDVCVKYG